MQESGCNENYPLAIVFTANLVSVLIWGIGAFILYQFGLIFFLAYVLYIFLLEVRLLAGHCVDCSYYGKTCAFGKGRLSSLLFRKGIPERFSRMQLTWKDILPDFLVFLIPFFAGILLLVLHFSWTIFILIIVLFLLAFPGNALVRGHLACRYCKQRKIGCPAEKLFDKNRK